MIESGGDGGGGGGGGTVVGLSALAQGECEWPACAAEWTGPSLTPAGHLTPDQVSAAHAGGGCLVLAVCVASGLAGGKDVGGVYSYQVWASPGDGVKCTDDASEVY